MCPVPSRQTWTSPSRHNEGIPKPKWVIYFLPSREKKKHFVPLFNSSSSSGSSGTMMVSSSGSSPAMDCIHFTVDKKTRFTVHRPGISSVRGQCHFYFQKGTFIEKIVKLLKGTKPKTRAKEAMKKVHSSQAWNFICERAMTFLLSKGHFQWKILESMGNFWRATKAKTRAKKAMACVKFQAWVQVVLNSNPLVSLARGPCSESSSLWQ